MRDRHFYPAQRDGVADDVIWRRKAELLEQTAQTAQHARRLFAGAHHVGVSAVGDKASVDPDPQPAHPLFDDAEIVGHCSLHGRRIERISASDHAQHGRCILSAAGHGADMVQRRGKWEYARPTHSTPGWLQAGEPVHGRREADRPQSIRASDPKQRPAAVATPEPLEETPVQCSELQGFTGGVMEG